MSPTEPVVIGGVDGWKAWCARARAKGPLGLVPTMGALHEGHLSLARRSAAENVSTVVSIFVNPTQFNDPKDLDAYPRTAGADVALLAEAGVDAVFLPEPATMYPRGYHYKIVEDDLSRKYCGAFRPGHFDGVLTVVMKLLNLTLPTRAYFGEKDYQQYRLIADMARDFFMDVDVVPCRIVRETNGLAMSSRNARLSAAGRQKASAIHRAIAGRSTAEEAAAELSAQGFEVEYVEDWNDAADGGSRRLVAAWLEGVRLIDNVAIGDTAGAGDTAGVGAGVGADADGGAAK